eukprot:CAMPEP_0113525740 /NCGR_PEP_ID=MMETSP0015_2-20120614/337_1 /TAXON_ID=2838 /ORGANISM="Odontella" /LENGTH=636 /DNA_ID=CAMNT_0000423955 /DNA_START=281 /DNA_END=2188 /DNA_ORIENTATION=- /assembly_acc=CAM_ASM_000160
MDRYSQKAQKTERQSVFLCDTFAKASDISIQSGFGVSGKGQGMLAATKRGDNSNALSPTFVGDTAALGMHSVTTKSGAKGWDSVESHLQFVTKSISFHAGEGSEALHTLRNNDECNRMACEFSARAPTNMDKIGADLPVTPSISPQLGLPSLKAPRPSRVDIQDDGCAEVILCSTDVDTNVRSARLTRRYAPDEKSTAQQSDFHKNSFPSFFCDWPPTCHNAVAVTPESSRYQKFNWPCSVDKVCFMNDAREKKTLEQQKSIEDTIATFLGNTGGWCDGWQAWTLHMEGTDSAAFSDPEGVRNILRNRAWDINARVRRIQKLRDDLSPFESPFDQPPHGDVETDDSDSVIHTKQVELRRCRSFPAKFDTSRLTSLSPEATESVVSMVSSGIESLQNCGDTNFKNEMGEQEDLCYDSDPGEVDYRRRDRCGSGNTRSRRKNMRTVETFLQNGPWRKDMDSHTRRSEVLPRKSNRIDPFHGNLSERVQENHDNMIYSSPSSEDTVWCIVKSMLNCKMTLIWHQNSDVYSTNKSPIAVTAWIELGSNFRSNLIQPRLMWKPVHGDDDERGSLGITNLGAFSFDLLDISRVLKPKRIDRERHPLANRSRSFLVETFDQFDLFEASSEKERDDIIFGLKLT